MAAFSTPPRAGSMESVYGEQGTVMDPDLAHIDGNEGEEAEEHEKDVEEAHRKMSEKKEKQRKRLMREMTKAHQHGVCYLSRIPPHLKPLKLRHLLSQYGEVLRIYLAPEDPAVRVRRKMAGKNTGKNFTEGWVEFANKKDAKKVAKMLNGEPMAYRNAVREQKQAADISAAKRERDFYLAKVDQSKAINAMEERKKKKQRTDLPATSEPNDGEPVSMGPTKVVRHFPQKKSVAIREDGGAPRLSQDILAAVMGKK